MVWLRVMMPQKTIRAQKAGVFMATAAETPSAAGAATAPAGASAAASVLAASAPYGSRPLSAGLLRTTKSVNGSVPTSVISAKTRYATRQPSAPEAMSDVPIGLKITPPMPVNAMHRPTKKPTFSTHQALMRVGIAR